MIELVGRRLSPVKLGMNNHMRYVRFDALITYGWEVLKNWAITIEHPLLKM